MNLNMNYSRMKDSYFFTEIVRRTDAYLTDHPGTHLLRLGIGDVTLPLCPAVIRALHEAVEEQAHRETFHGYLPECGLPFLREAVAKHYGKRGVPLTADEIFVSSGAGDDLGSILHLFDRRNTVLVMEPAYPAYADTNTMDGRRILRLLADEESGFLPGPEGLRHADLIYICSPNNPTGSVFTKEKLQSWVDFANRTGAVILFDAAYEAFVSDPDLPRSIYEIPGAETCAIEISSLSKTAGFTGTRLGYTAVPRVLVRKGLSLNAMWTRDRSTRTNGVSYILQKGAAAVFTEEGQAQIRENLSVYKKNAELLAQTFDEIGFRYCGGKNAPYLWTKCPDGMGSWDFFRLLLEELQIVGTPGTGFGSCGEGYFRFSAFGSPEDTAEAAERLKRRFG